MVVLSVAPQKAPPTSYFVGVEAASQALVLRFVSQSNLLARVFSSMLGGFILGSAPIKPRRLEALLLQPSS